MHGARVYIVGDKVGSIFSLYFRTSPVIPQAEWVLLQAKAINRHDKLLGLSVFRVGLLNCT